jgi:hypothetical protein
MNKRFITTKQIPHHTVRQKNIWGIIGTFFILILCGIVLFQVRYFLQLKKIITERALPRFETNEYQFSMMLLQLDSIEQAVTGRIEQGASQKNKPVI